MSGQLWSPSKFEKVIRAEVEMMEKTGRVPCDDDFLEAPSPAQSIRIEALRVAVRSVDPGAGTYWVDGKEVTQSELVLFLAEKFAAWLETGER